MEIRALLAHGITQHPGQRCVVRLEQRDPRPDPLAGGSDFGPDEPGADDDDPRRVASGDQVCSDPQAVVEGAQHPHVSHPVGPGKASGRGPGGNHQAVVCHFGTIVTGNRPRLRIEAGRSTPESELEVQAVVSIRGVVTDPLGVPLAG